MQPLFYFLSLWNIKVSVWEGEYKNLIQLKAILLCCNVTIVLGFVHYTPEKFENRDFTLKTHFLSILRRRNLNTQQSPAIFDLCLRKSRSGKSRGYRLSWRNRFQIVFRPQENEMPAFS